MEEGKEGEIDRQQFWKVSSCVIKGIVQQCAFEFSLSGYLENSVKLKKVVVIIDLYYNCFYY